MHHVITQKMKDEFLKALKGYYDAVGTTTPIKEYEFTLATKWYADNFPMLRYGLPSSQDHQVTLMEHLVADDILKVNSQKGIAFYLTEKGFARLQKLMDGTDVGKVHPEQEPYSHSQKWYAKPFGIIILGLVVAILYEILKPHIFTPIN